MGAETLDPNRSRDVAAPDGGVADATALPIANATSGAPAHAVTAPKTVFFIQVPSRRPASQAFPGGVL